jgi:inosine/xanthosine triphosphatase
VTAQADEVRTIVVASTNPVKLAAASEAVAQVFPGWVTRVVPVRADSGVPDQPMGDEQTLQGALNRLEASRREVSDAALWFAFEGGCGDVPGEPGALHAFAWVVVTDGRRTSRARTATFPLPPVVAALVRRGVELGHADDAVFGREGSKQSNGAVGLLSKNLIDRTAYYRHAAILALLLFLDVNGAYTRPGPKDLQYGLHDGRP